MMKWIPIGVIKINDDKSTTFIFDDRISITSLNSSKNIPEYVEDQEHIDFLNKWLRLSLLVDGKIKGGLYE